MRRESMADPKEHVYPKGEWMSLEAWEIFSKPQPIKMKSIVLEWWFILGCEILGGIAGVIILMLLGSDEHGKGKG